MLSFSETKVAIKLILSSGKGNNVPYINGLAGIGKTQLVMEYANDIGAYLETITASIQQEGDTSMPMAVQGKKIYDEEGNVIEKESDKVIYILHYALVNIMEYAKRNPGKPIILFLDEFNRASAPVQSELMNLVLQRELAGYVLPKECKLILAGNPGSETSVFDGGNSNYAVNSMDDAIMDRITMIHMTHKLSDWIRNFANKYSKGSKVSRIDYRVTTFLESHAHFFEGRDTRNEEADIKATPRSWERVSDIIREHDEFIKQGEYVTLREESFEQDSRETVLNLQNKILQELLVGNVGNIAGNALIQSLADTTEMILPKEFIASSLEDLTKKVRNIVSPVRQQAVFRLMIEHWMEDNTSLTDEMVDKFVIVFDKEVAKEHQYVINHMIINLDTNFNPEKNPEVTIYKEIRGIFMKNKLFKETATRLLRETNENNL